MEFGSADFRSKHRWKTAAANQLPTAYLLRVSLRRLMECKDKLNHYWQCNHCAENPDQNRQYLPPMDDVGLQKLIALHPLLLQLLSCIDIGMAIEERFNGFASGNLHSPGKLAAPFISHAFNGKLPTPADYAALQSLLVDGRQYNVIMQQYKTVLELSDMPNRLRILNNESIDRIIFQPAKRGPVSMIYNKAHRDTVMTLIDHTRVTNHPNPQLTVLAGQVQRRDAEAPESVHATLKGEIAGHLTREALLFPYLFGLGVGDFQGKGSKEFNHYAALRLGGFLSPYTLLATYPLHLFLAKQSMGWTPDRVAVLDQQASKIRKENPDLEEEELQKRLLKRHLPAEVYGAPQYFKKKLEDLKAMVNAHGLPTFFVTFTADEVSPDSKWHEVTSLEQMFRE